MKGSNTMTTETYSSLIEKIALIHKKRRKLNVLEEKLQQQLMRFTLNQRE